MRKARIYLAGPYTKPDPAQNTHNAVIVANVLMDKGYAPFVPHLTHMWHLITPRPYEEWLDLDNQWLIACDAVYRIQGESSGADKEVALAVHCKIPVFSDLETLFKSVPALV